MTKYKLPVREIAMIFVRKFGVVETSRRLEISRVTLWRWKKFGITCKQRCNESKLFSRAGTLIRDFVIATQCTNARAIRYFLQKDHDISVSVKTVYKFLSQLRFSRKRVRHRGTSKKPVAELIEEYKRMYCEYILSGKTLVSVDECGFSERHRMLYGYSPVGKPCILKTSGGWKNHSLLMAVSSNGEKSYTIFDGSVKKESFARFIDSLNLSPNHVVLADNASIHKNLKLTRPACIMYTPPYEPDSNPIEMCFSQAKRLFRERNVGVDVKGLIAECVDEAVKPGLVKKCFDHVTRTYVGVTGAPRTEGT